MALGIDGHRARLIPKAIEDDCLTQVKNRTRRIAVSGLGRIKLSLQNHSVSECLLRTAKTTECKTMVTVQKKTGLPPHWPYIRF